MEGKAEGQDLDPGLEAEDAYEVRLCVILWRGGGGETGETGTHLTNDFYLYVMTNVILRPCSYKTRVIFIRFECICHHF